MRITTYLIFLFLPIVSLCQDFVFVTSDRDLLAVDVSTCTTTFLCTVQSPASTSVGDLTYTPDGTLWGIGVNATLFTINENTGATNLITTFPNAGELFTAMVADASGVLYVADEQGDLFSYDPATNTTDYLGDVGPGAAGDLTFANGQLVMATVNNTMIAIDLDDPTNPEFILNFNVSTSIFGIVTFAEDCNNTVTYATSGSADLYEIDFLTNNLTYICDLGFSSFGAASALEFLAANPIQVEMVNVANTTCAVPDGSIEVITSGSNSVQYSLDGENFQSSNVFNGLGPGLYTVYMLDDNNCMEEVEAEVLAIGDAPMITQFTSTPVLCGEPTGSISIEVEGGEIPYLYRINGGPLESGNTFENLALGTYTILVQDMQGCTDVVSVTVEGTAELTITNLNVVPCGASGNSIAVSVSGGNGDYEYSLDGVSFQNANSFEQLGPGPFDIYVQDSDGCTAQGSGVIPEVPEVEVALIELQACGAIASSLEVNASGGVGGYEYSLEQGPFTGSGQFENLSPGTYTIIAADENGCLSEPLSVEIPAIEPLQITSLEVSDSQCGKNTGRIDLSAEGGTAPLSYFLNNQPFLNPPFDNLGGDVYVLEVVDDEGCSQTDTLLIIDFCPVYIPNSFSPNGDGRNDLFQIYSGVNIEIIKYQIFDQWGGMVYEQLNFSSAEQQLFWDGTLNGDVLNPDVYTYNIEIVNTSGLNERFKGAIHLVK
jgi:gliding motility-associated-like protein